MVLCHRLLSRGTVFSRFVPIVAWISTPFLFVTECCPITWMYCLLFMHSWGRNLSDSHISGVTSDDAALSILVFACVLTSLRHRPRSSRMTYSRITHKLRETWLSLSSLVLRTFQPAVRRETPGTCRNAVRDSDGWCEGARLLSFYLGHMLQIWTKLNLITLQHSDCNLSVWGCVVLYDPGIISLKWTLDTR